MTTTLGFPELRPRSAERTRSSHVGEAQGGPVYLVDSYEDSALDVLCADGVVTITPQAPRSCRHTIRPVAIFHNQRGYFEANQSMGRLVFARGAQEPQTYQPYTRDPQRTLEALFLCVERMPEDEQYASPARWANMEVVARRLFDLTGVPYRGPRQVDVDRFLRFIECPDPIEALALYALTAWCAPCGRFAVEIDSYRGRSLTVMALSLDAAGSALPLVSVDPHQVEPFNIEQVRLALRQVGQERRLIQAPMLSDDAAGLLRPGSAALVFIDGDHAYEQVRADFTHYDELLAPGGVMAFHDYGYGAHTGLPDTNPDVRRAVDDLVFTHPGYRPLLCAHITMAFQKQR